MHKDYKTNIETVALHIQNRQYHQSYRQSKNNIYVSV